MYSYRIEQAIRAATILHRDQVRKGNAPIPYVAHLMAVSYIVMDYTDDEDVFIAALLHDTLEDTDYTSRELQEDFGGTVRKIVETLSEPADTKERNYGWNEKKRQYIAQLKEASEAALLVCAADKIHNMRSIVEEYFDDQARFLKDFKGTLKERLLMYDDISSILNERLKNDIVNEFNHVFSEYKSFLDNVKTSNNTSE